MAMSYNGNTPPAFRGRAGNTNQFSHKYPSGESPKIYTKIDFFEYKRDIADARGDRRQTGSIQLPTPITFNDRTAVRTKDSELSYLGAAAQFAAKGMSGPQGLAEITNSLNTSLGGMSRSSLAKNAFDIISLLPGGMDATSQDLARSFSGIVPNPHVTALFEGVNLKTFQLSWQLLPRSQQDADALKSIVHRLRARALPSALLVAGFNYALEYPDLVRVSIIGNKTIEASRFAFIESVLLSGGSGTQIPFFKDGSVVEQNLTLELKEIDIRTREDYEGPDGVQTFGAN